MPRSRELWSMRPSGGRVTYTIGLLSFSVRVGYDWKSYEHLMDIGMILMNIVMENCHQWI